MAVIINEFEVIPDTGSTEGETPEDMSQPPERNVQIRPMDIFDVLQHQMSRMIRTLAH